MRKPRNYWTKEKCQEESLKYTKISDMQKKSNGSYSSILKNKWNIECFNHMIQLREKNGYWTKEKCQEESLKYKTRYDFIKYGKGSVSSSISNNWITEICSHMIKRQNLPNYWTFEKCQEESLKYKSRSEFYNNSKGSYFASLKNNWLNDICSHMKRKGNRYNKCIYSYEFSDNTVYVGLTYNLEERQKNRNNNKNDQVTKHIRKTGLIPIRKQLTNYLVVDYASKMEGFYVKLYKLKGWNILNIAKTGNIGGYINKITFEKCKEESLKYKTKKEFRCNSNSMYVISKKNKWLDEICSHMIQLRKKNGYWTFEKCKEESLKYIKRSDFKINSSSAYGISLKNGWLDKICSHMIKLKNKTN